VQNNKEMKTALVTGASSGIGYELAICHAKAGGDLIVAARSVHQLNMLKSTVESKYGVKCEVIPTDLTEENAGKKLLDEIDARKLSVDYLINNAGVGMTGEFIESDIAGLQQMVQLNITALMDLCYYFVHEKRKANKPAKVLNVASTAAFQGIPYVAVYAATKAFVLSFSEGLAGELKKTDITVTALCPGPTKSNFGLNANIDEKMANFPLFPTASKVAKYGYEQMLKGEVTAVHGVANKIGVLSTKVSRGAVGAIAGGVFKLSKK
jgi:short-subunit dehydrogenase